jgi:septum formation protein
LIIGADQVADLEGLVLGKPGTVEKAAEQLTICSGRTVIFRSGLCVLDSRSGLYELDVVETAIHYRELTEGEIQTYIATDNPLDCAGAMRSESLGIALTESITSNDPTALMGLPLIRLSALLRQSGLQVLQQQ